MGLLGERLTLTNGKVMKDEIRVSCFGASVTQQKTGYATLLESELGSNYKVTTHGFGGTYLNDAGVIYINTVLKDKPDICVVDWFSTQFENKIPLNNIEICLGTMIRQFSIAKCKLLFLFLPRTDTNVRHEFYDECFRVLKKYKMEYLDLIKEYDPNSCKILRDYVHTTDLGSSLYASRISVELKQRILNIPTKLPPDNIYCNIKSIKLDDIEIYDKLELSGNCMFVGANLTLGPYSGVVELAGVRQNTWDSWCHYERRGIKISNIPIDGKTELKILQNGFSRKGCKVQLKWGDYKRKIVLHEIFYSGELSVGNFL